MSKVAFSLLPHCKLILYVLQMHCKAVTRSIKYSKNKQGQGPPILIYNTTQKQETRDCSGSSLLSDLKLGTFRFEQTVLKFQAYTCLYS